MNEPWDSPANKKVLDKMPAVFRSPFDDPTIDEERLLRLHRSGDRV